MDAAQWYVFLQQNFGFLVNERLVLLGANCVRLFKFFYTARAVKTSFISDDKDTAIPPYAVFPLEKRLHRTSVCIEYMGNGRCPTTSLAIKISFGTSVQQN